MPRCSPSGVERRREGRTMRQPRGAGRTWLALLIVAGLLLSACDLFPSEATPTPVAAPTAPAEVSQAIMIREDDFLPPDDPPAPARASSLPVARRSQLPPAWRAEAGPAADWWVRPALVVAALLAAAAAAAVFFIRSRPG